MKSLTNILFSLLALVALTISTISMAAPEEIQVYMDDMSSPGQFGLDIHNNYVTSGGNQPAYPGALPTLHQYRLTPEFYYGLTDDLELGFYVLTAHAADNISYVEGEKARIKYIAPHNANSGAFWGVNLEVGRTSLLASPTPWNAEIKGIWGYRFQQWTFAVNPNLDWSLSSGGGPVTMQLDGKVAYNLTEKTQIGIETYNELGPVSSLQALNQNSKTVYLALDHDFGSVDINAGIGRGLNSEGDRWVLKLIVGTHF